MSIKINKNIKLYKILLYLSFLFSLIFGLVFNENSSGGAFVDHKYLFPFIYEFYLDLELGFNKFLQNSGSLIHSPFFYIIFGILLKITNSIESLKYIYIFVSSFLPLIFYKILKKKFKTNNNYLFLISLIIFLSPYFRSSAIWLLGDNLSLIFFGISILFFLKFEKKKNANDLYISIFFLILCSYIRYYYSVYYIFYIYNIINFNKNLLIKSIIFSLFFSIPAIIYFYFILIKHDYLNTLESFGSINFISSGAQIVSICLFYLLPFVIDKKLIILKYYIKNYKIIILFSVFFFLTFYIGSYFEIDLIYFSDRGGGVFLKLIDLIKIDRKLSILILCLISILVMDFLFKGNRANNYLLVLTLILSLPLITIYQKYLDPLIYLLVFGLIKSDYLNMKFKEQDINLYIIFAYFGMFYIFSLIYYI
jgi:hypothetical protein